MDYLSQKWYYKITLRQKYLGCKTAPYPVMDQFVVQGVLHVKRLRLIVPVLLIVLFSLPVFALQRTYTYQETTGDQTIISKWLIESTSEGHEVIVENPAEYHRLLCAEDYSTISWEYQNTETGTDLVAKVQADRVIIKGKHNQEKVQEEFELQGLPWYQFIEVSLADFVQSKERKKEFWIIQPYDLKVYKMVASKEKTETITLSNQEVETAPVKVTLTGIASAFWKVKYWYRKADGFYLRYEGVRGGPGTPKTIVEVMDL